MTSKEEEEEEEKYKVLRVTQLDTIELDSELINQYKQFTEDCFKYIRCKFIIKYQIEINTAIKLIIWYFTYNKTSQTIGQSILNWSYNTNKSKFKNNSISKYIHLIFFCFDDYLEAKIENKNLLSLFKVFEFLNFLKFLYSGDYLQLWERVFKFKPFYNKQQELREINTEYTEREFIWQSYFLLIKLLNSIFNFKSMTILKLILKQKDNNIKLNSIENDNGNDEKNINELKCYLCNDLSLTNAYRFKLCNLNHYYCYYCIKMSSNTRKSCNYCVSNKINHDDDDDDDDIEPYFKN